MSSRQCEAVVGVVGCGYVADFYAMCLKAKAPEIKLGHAYDLEPKRAESFSNEYGCTWHRSLDDLLRQEGLDVVLNLTPPSSHAGVTERALRSGKHVYSEKPLATDLSVGVELVRLAVRKDLALAAAPAVHHSPSADLMAQVLQAGGVGDISHIYCDIDDGPVHRMEIEEWRSVRGIRWPYGDEFRTGPVVHHLPYALDWVTHFAGAVVSVRGHTTIAVDRKCGAEAGPDLCMALLVHEGGCLSRITVGALAARRRELRLVMRGCELCLEDVWSVDGPVRQDDAILLDQDGEWPYASTHRINFEQGIRDMIAGIRSHGGSAVTQTQGARALHILEITLALSSVGPSSFRPRTGLRILD